MGLIFEYFQDAVSKYKLLFFKALQLTMIVSLLNIIVPYGLRYYVSYLVADPTTKLIVLGIILALIYICISIGAKIMTYRALDDFGGAFINDLTIRLENALARADLRDVDAIGRNTLKHILYADVLDVFRVLGHHLPNLIGAILIAVISIVLSFFYSPFITVFIFISLIIGFALSIASRKMISLKATATNRKMKVHNSMINQYIDSTPLVQCNNIFPYYKSHTEYVISDFIKTTKKEDVIILFWSGLVDGYNTLFKMMLSSILALPISGGSIVNLVFYTFLANMVMEQGSIAEGLIRQIMRANVSFVNVSKILHIKERGGDAQLERIYTINFEDVSFSYGIDSPEVLHDVSVELNPGDMVRLRGGNGSGKSTFIKLLINLYAPSKGCITYNDTDKAIYSIESVNSQIVYINQDEMLLNESIDDYLSIMANTSISNERLNELRAFTGLEEPIGTIANNGLSLSVGQRKKLLLMKLMLRIEEASLIILDEIEAGMDRMTCMKFEEYLQNVSKEGNKIIVMVEHSDELNIPFNRELQFDRGTVNEIIETK